MIDNIVYLYDNKHRINEVGFVRMGLHISID